MNVGTTGKQIAKATAAPPFYGEGDAVPLSTDLNGGLRVGPGGGGGLAGVLGMLFDGRVEFNSASAGVNDGDNIISPLVGWSRGAMASAAFTDLFQEPAGAAASGILRIQNNRRWMQVNSTVGAAAIWILRPGGNAQSARTFMDTYPPMTSAPRFGDDPSFLLEALVKKQAAGDATDCRFWFGFYTNNLVTPSGAVARAGLVGDGAQGFRFGSVNCPDGVVGANAANAIDANAIQPAELVNPGANAFKVGIKIIPATPTQTGRWSAYLNDTFVGSFATLANLPRGNTIGGVPTNLTFTRVDVAFGMLTDGVALTGPMVSSVRVVVADDWTA